MAKYLEYDKSSGRIISEIISDEQPETFEGYGLLEIDENQEIDTTIYGVRQGNLVKIHETTTERLERERLRKERQEQTRLRVKAMTYEICLALLDDNDSAVKELQAEFRKLKASM